MHSKNKKRKKRTYIETGIVQWLLLRMDTGWSKKSGDAVSTLPFQTYKCLFRIKLWHNLGQFKVQANQKAAKYLNTFTFPFGRINLLNDNLKTQFIKKNVNPFNHSKL